MFISQIYGVLPGNAGKRVSYVYLCVLYVILYLVLYFLFVRKYSVDGNRLVPY